jgi:hypothetical protein
MAKGQQLLQFSILLANGEWPRANSFFNSSFFQPMANGEWPTASSILHSHEPCCFSVIFGSLINGI